jgi:glycosyltransferase involved in cell wall biosynthesis
MAGRVATLVSVCAPMLNEQGTARVFYERVCAALEGVAFELVIVDDGSTDTTSEILADLAAADDRVKIVELSRNFGHQTAITAAIDHAEGDVVVMIDADLQDPPELIVTMLQKWSEGCDVVYAARRQRDGETRFKLGAARMFYRMLSAVADIEVQYDSGDFRLLDRRAVDALLSMRERNRYLRGMTVWVGFTQIAVPYDRDARYAGETKYTLRKMIRFGLDAIASFSHAPLQAATLVGFLFAAMAFVCVPIAIGLRIAGHFIPGFATAIIVILLLGGIQLMAIGVIGEYVGRIYDEVKRRPLYVVKGRHNLPDHSDEDERLRHERTPAS